ncbi:gliding motility lipoprotein GldB [Pontibacter liquoris]|uniref:gliding motility lipoprotein GldB n=1 Tax=Pontibacter liquoris TaxID=2905677 RepID=UPI001FA6B024|nr:gliding motility lipoprotein GldB [Pontibacter liquoris]
MLCCLGCGKKGCELPDDIAKMPVDVKIERLEKPFFAATSRQDIARFLQEHPLFADKYLQRRQYPSDSLLITPLYELATNPALDTLEMQAEQTFADMRSEEQQLETAFKVIKYHYPKYHVPQVKTFVTGLGSMGNDLFVSDSLLVFGLDYFIGPKAKYRPKVYEYILKRYQRQGMVPAAMLLLSNNFNKTSTKDRNLLAEMINTGKAYYFVQSVMPCAPDSAIIGYSGQQVADINYNEGRIWAHFIEKGLLYEKSPFLVNKYIGERPATPEIDAKAPGRLGTWVGWQIVRKYMERNPDVTLPQLMEETDYQKIFSGSKYKPERRR